MLPISANCASHSGLTSTLAPTSSSTHRPASVGICAASAGRYLNNDLLPKAPANVAAFVSDPANFTVVLDMRVVGDKLKAAGVGEALTYYRGKTVRVTGTVTVFNDRPQIVVEDAGQITVVDK